MRLKTIITIIAMAIITMATTASASDSLGIIGSLIVDSISGVDVVGPFAVTIYTVVMAALGWLIARLVPWLLTRIPTKWKWSEKLQDVTVSVFWRVLRRLFGKSILFYRMRADTDKEKEMALKKFKDHVRKHDPIASIDIRELK